MWKLSYWFSQLLAFEKKTESWKQEREREIKKERLSDQEPKGKDTCFCYINKPETQIITRLWLVRKLPSSASYKGEGNLKSVDHQGGWGETSLASWSLRACWEHSTSGYPVLQRTARAGHRPIWAAWKTGNVFGRVWFGLVFLELWNLKRMEKGKSRVRYVQNQRLWKAWRRHQRPGEEGATDSLTDGLNLGTLPWENRLPFQKWVRFMAIK